MSKMHANLSKTTLCRYDMRCNKLMCVSEDRKGCEERRRESFAIMRDWTIELWKCIGNGESRLTTCVDIRILCKFSAHMLIR